MSTNFFDPPEEDFRDVPEEVETGGMSEIDRLQQMQAIAPLPTPRPVAMPADPNVARGTYPTQAPSEEYYLDEYADVNYGDEEEDYSAVMADARLRLEQGRLYEIIMNHDLFEGTDADEQAVKHVQRQIRKFAKEQMEIMLGMRKETAKIERLEIDFPFNEVEVKVLKMVASKASGGASEHSDRYVPAVTKTTEEVPVIETPKKAGLNPIGARKPAAPAPRPQPTPQRAPQPAPQQPRSALRQQATAPIARKPVQSNTPEFVVVDGERVTRDQIDSTFDPNYKPLDKPLEKMTTDELIRRNQEASQRGQRRATNPNAMPMLTYEQEEFMHLTRASEMAAKGGGAISKIVAAMNNGKS